MWGDNSHIDATTTASSKSVRKSTNHCCEKGSGDRLKRVRSSQNQHANNSEMTDEKSGDQRARNSKAIEAIKNPSMKKRFLNTRYPVPGSISKARSQFQDLKTSSSDNKCENAVPMNTAAII